MKTIFIVLVYNNNTGERMIISSHTYLTVFCFTKKLHNAHFIGEANGT